MTVAASVAATNGNSRLVLALFACRNRSFAPLSHGRFSSGGRGREFKSHLPDQHFRHFLSRSVVRCCRYSCGNEYGPMGCSRIHTGPDQERKGASSMADSLPKKILPLLEGRYGELTMMRFWSKVDMRGPSECWEWQASLTTSGYGRFKIASYETAIASRVALIGTKKEEPFGMLVLHTCDNPCCCNPAHLYFGTQQDNMNDKVQRGRCRSGDQSGPNNGAAKLSEAQLAVIVQRLQDGWNNKQIAADLPVTHSMVSLIRRGKMWRDYTERLGWEPKPVFLRKAA